MYPPPYRPGLLAQARHIVTCFDTVIAENGEAEARTMRGEAWQILLASHAARLKSRRPPQLRPDTPTSGDAA